MEECWVRMSDSRTILETEGLMKRLHGGRRGRERERERKLLMKTMAVSSRQCTRIQHFKGPVSAPASTEVSNPSQLSYRPQGTQIQVKLRGVALDTGQHCECTMEATEHVRIIWYSQYSMYSTSHMRVSAHAVVIECGGPFDTSNHWYACTCMAAVG